MDCIGYIAAYPINKEKERQQKNTLLSLLFEYKKNTPRSPTTDNFNESILEARATHSYSPKAAELGRISTIFIEKLKNMRTN